MRQPGAVVLAGERLAEVPGALSALPRCPGRPAHALAWVPRRAGERGAVEAGALPGLLPGGRPVADAAARADVAQRWGWTSTSSRPPRAGTRRRSSPPPATASWAAVVGGVDPADLPDPGLAARGAGRGRLRRQPRAVPERRHGGGRRRLPVATASEKAGSYLDWEGRVRSFDATCTAPARSPTAGCCRRIADEMDVDLGCPRPRRRAPSSAALGSARRPAEGVGLAVAPVAPPR